MAATPTDPLFIAVNAGAPSYTANELRTALALALMYDGRLVGARKGVRPGGDQLKVSLAGSTITVQPGVGCLDPALTTTQGPYWAAILTADTHTLTAADATNPRKDIVILRVYDHDEDASGLRQAITEYLVGTPNPSPAEPSLPASAIKLALIDVPASPGSPVVTDRRPWTVSPGGILPVAAAADIAAGTEGRYRDRLDTNVLERDSGAAWATVADPSIFTSWSSYVPSWSSTGTAVALGNGTLVGRQRRVGEIQHVFIRLTWGSTTTGGTGAWQFTLPATPNFANQALVGMARDTSAGFPYPVVCKMNSSIPEINEMGAHSATGAIGQVDVDHPFVWANTDILTIEGSYMVTG